MEFVWFNLFSTLESIGMFILLLTLFRFDIREYFIHTIFASFILSQMSFFLRTVYDFGNIVPLLYVLYMFLFIWLMFQIPVLYAAIMAIIGYITFFLLQGVFIFIVLIFDLFPLEEIAPFTLLAYIVQTISFGLSLFISWILGRIRFGFTFIPNKNLIIQTKSENTILLVTSLISIIILLINYNWSLNSAGHLIFTVILFLVLFLSILYVAVHREMKSTK